MSPGSFPKKLNLDKKRKITPKNKIPPPIKTKIFPISSRKFVCIMELFN